MCRQPLPRVASLLHRQIIARDTPPTVSIEDDEQESVEERPTAPTADEIAEAIEVSRSCISPHETEFHAGLFRRTGSLGILHHWCCTFSLLRFTTKRKNGKLCCMYPNQA